MLEEVQEWFDALADVDRRRVLITLGRLREEGPTLSRPASDTLRVNRMSNLTELRPVSTRGQAIRILYAFDSRRRAVMLVAGNKAEAGWDKWYRQAIPLAVKRYEEWIVENS